MACRFDYGAFNISEEYFKMDDAVAAGEYLFARKFAIQQLFLPSEHWVIMQIFLQRQDAFTMGYGIKNRATGAWQWCNYVGRDNPSVFARGVQLLTDTHLYLMVEPDRLLGDSALRSSPLLTNHAALGTLTPDSNYVILKCELQAEAPQ